MTDDERAVLGLLLEGASEGAEALRQQARRALVVGRCDCGCPTFHLRVPDDGVPRAVLGGRLWPIEGRVDSHGATPDQEIILFVDDGRLSSLELVYYTEKPPASWPRPAEIKLV